MWRTLLVISVLASANSYAQDAGLKKDPPSAESRRAEAIAQEQSRVQALAQRGLTGNYQLLLGAGKVPAQMKGQSVALNAQQIQAASRVAAIDLAALGFTAADIKTHSRRKSDLFDIAYRLYQGKTSPIEQMLLVDTVVIATAGKVVDNRTRNDGFLSATPYVVVKSLKGSRAVGDSIYLPRRSGPKSDGVYLEVSSDIEVTPGKKYLLAISKNWHEQRVTETKKQIESGFNAIPFLVYEISDDGTLLPSPRPTLFGEAPKDVQSVEDELQKLSVSKAGQGGRDEN